MPGRGKTFWPVPAWKKQKKAEMIGHWRLLVLVDPFATIRSFAKAAETHLDMANAPICYVHSEPAGPATLALVESSFLDKLLTLAVEHNAVEHHDGLVNHSHIEAGEDEEDTK